MRRQDHCDEVSSSGIDLNFAIGRRSALRMTRKRPKAAPNKSTVGGSGTPEGSREADLLLIGAKFGELPIKFSPTAAG